MTVMEKVGHSFEPEAVENFGEEYALMASIAISLKRLADGAAGNQGAASEVDRDKLARAVESLRGDIADALPYGLTYVSSDDLTTVMDALLPALKQKAA